MTPLTCSSERRLEFACLQLRQWYEGEAKKTAREYQERKRSEGLKILARAEARASSTVVLSKEEQAAEAAEQLRRARGRQYTGLACSFYEPPRWAFLASGFMKLVVSFWVLIGVFALLTSSLTHIPAVSSATASPVYRTLDLSKLEVGSTYPIGFPDGSQSDVLFKGRMTNLPGAMPSNAQLGDGWQIDEHLWVLKETTSHETNWVGP